MLTTNKLDRLERVFLRHTGMIEGQFHSLLWHIMADDTLRSESDDFAFHWLHDGQLILACSGGGYIETHCYAGQSAKSRDEKKRIAEELNASVFGFNADAAEKVVIESFSAAAKSVADLPVEEVLQRAGMSNSERPEVVYKRAVDTLKRRT